MVGEDPFEGLLATLTTERGKEDLVREEIERQEGVRIISMERTSTGWRVIAVPKPGGGGWDPFRSGGGSAPPEEGAGPEIWYYWWYEGYKWPRIPLKELCPEGHEEMKEIRTEGIGYVKKKGRERIALIETGLVQLGPPKFKHEGGDLSCPWEMWCHPDLKASLEELYRVLKDEYRKSELRIASAYRRVGTHVVGADRAGHLDQGDEEGHWKGLSVDVNREVTDEWFPGQDSLLDSILARPGIGLSRPYYPRRFEERNHFALK